MIKQKTVFVLGAGASAPYGYPTSEGLRQWLKKDLIVSLNNDFKLRQRLAKDEITYVYDDLDYFIEEYSGTDRGLFIDLFLNNRSVFKIIGKWAITAAIFYHESISKYSDDIKKPVEDWMSELFKILKNDIKNDNYSRILENNISFISFNYDRSLEYALHRSLMRGFGASSKQAASVIQQIPIIHVFGQVSKMPWDSSETIEFRPDLTKINLSDWSENIHIMYSNRNTDDCEKAQKLLKEAKSIYCLGFGYADENLEAIGIPDVLNNGQILRGTGYEMSNVDKSSIERKMRGDKLIESVINLFPGTDSAGLIKTYRGKLEAP